MKVFSVVNSARADSAVVPFHSTNCLYHRGSCWHSQHQLPPPQRGTAFLCTQQGCPCSLCRRCQRAALCCDVELANIWRFTRCFFYALIGSQLSNVCKLATESGFGGLHVQHECQLLGRTWRTGEPFSSQCQGCEGHADSSTGLFIPTESCAGGAAKPHALLTIDCLHFTAGGKSRAVAGWHLLTVTAPELQTDRAFIPRSRAGPRCVIQPCWGAERPQALSCCLPHSWAELKHDKEQALCFLSTGA